MSSSTSSSSLEIAPRGPYVKALAVTVLGMGGALALLLIFGYFADANAENILERVTEARSYLPQIAEEEKPVVIAFGSSMTDAGFLAPMFDRDMAARGIDVKSFNFGFGGLNPYFQDYLSRRMRDAFQAEGKRVELAMVEFTPLQNTKARWEGAQPVVDSYVAMLGDGSDIWDVAREDLTRGSRMAVIKYLRNGVSAEMVTFYLGGEMFSERSRPDAGIEPDEEKEALLEELQPKLIQAYEDEFPDREDCDWCWKWQGAGLMREEREAQTLEWFSQYWEALRTEQRMSDDRLWRIQCCDIEELDFEEELVTGFIRTVKNFQEFSNQVEVVLLPRNHDWIQRGPEAWQRLEAVLERIERETGAKVRSFEDAPEITPQHFNDTTHLSRYEGNVAFTDLLVETYAPLLQR